MIEHVSCHPVRLIKHTKKLMDKEEKLCIKVLQTLREMLDKKECFQESVSTWPCDWNMVPIQLNITFRNQILRFHKETVIISHALTVP